LKGFLEEDIIDRLYKILVNIKIHTKQPENLEVMLGTKTKQSRNEGKTPK
jgi:hypothetical protein